MQSEVTTYYTVAQAAKMTGYSVPTIRNRIREIDPRLKESYVVMIDGYGGKPVTHICEHQVDLWKKENQDRGFYGDKVKEYVSKQEVDPIGGVKVEEGPNATGIVPEHIVTESNPAVKIFDNPEFGKVRTLLINQEPWLVGKDVAEALGYANTRDALRVHVDDEDKADVVIHDGRQNRTMAAINESGLYSLILSSKLPSAKQFKRWVTGEILPSIRKDGGYLTGQDVMLPDELMAHAVLYADKKIKEQSQKIRILQPKADYLDTIIDDEKLISTTVIAKHFGMSGMRLNSILKALGIQFKVGETWVLKSNYQNEGYAKIITGQNDRGTVYQQMKWTQKGRQFIYDQLNKRGLIQQSSGVVM